MIYRSFYFIAYILVLLPSLMEIVDYWIAYIGIFLFLVTILIQIQNYSEKKKMIEMSISRFALLFILLSSSIVIPYGQILGIFGVCLSFIGIRLKYQRVNQWTNVFRWDYE